MINAQVTIGSVLDGWLSRSGIMLAWAGCTAASPELESESGEKDSVGLDETDAESGETAESAETAETAETGDSGTDTADDLPAPPCVAYGEPVQMGAVVDEALDEISGVAPSARNPGVLWVHEDHLGGATVYGLDSAGNTVATLSLADATNNDWEDLVVAPCGEESCLWVGEIGNNDADRVGLGFYRFVEPDLATSGSEIEVEDWDFYGFVYPGDAENAEGFVVGLDGYPVIFTKRYDLGTAGIYRLGALETEATLEWLGEFPTSKEGDEGAASALTSASLWPDGSRLLLRTYSSVFELDAAGGWSSLPEQTRVEIAGPEEAHGEALGYDEPQLGFWQVAEGINPAVWFTPCDTD